MDRSDFLLISATSRISFSIIEMPPIGGARIDLLNIFEVDSAVSTYPVLRSIVHDLRAKVIRRSDVSRLRAILWVYKIRIILIISKDEEIFIWRHRHLILPFWQDDFRKCWEEEGIQTCDRQCVARLIAPTCVMIKLEEYTYGYYDYADRDVMRSAIVQLKRTPDLLLEGMRDLEVISKLRKSWTNIYLTDLLSTDDFSTLRRDALGSRTGTGMYWQIRRVLETCSLRLSLYVFLIDAAAEHLSNSSFSLHIGPFDQVSLVREFRDLLLSVWSTL